MDSVDEWEIIDVDDCQPSPVPDAPVACDGTAMECPSEQQQKKKQFEGGKGETRDEHTKSLTLWHSERSSVDSRENVESSRTLLREKTRVCATAAHAILIQEIDDIDTAPHLSAGNSNSVEPIDGAALPQGADAAATVQRRHAGEPYREEHSVASIPDSGADSEFEYTHPNKQELPATTETTIGPRQVNWVKRMHYSLFACLALVTVWTLKGPFGGDDVVCARGSILTRTATLVNVFTLVIGPLVSMSVYLFFGKSMHSRVTGANGGSERLGKVVSVALKTLLTTLVFSLFTAGEGSKLNRTKAARRGMKEDAAGAHASIHLVSRSQRTGAASLCLRRGLVQFLCITGFLLSQALLQHCSRAHKCDPSEISGGRSVVL
ncbi:hypothetical protein ERJ75_001341700 [Trypanosoma vivax]|uniref:Transmembrane protein n=1 Tax=Trypanosoma vivax (strain Y486) TaxID=1055687 RepID=G0U5Z7_TRYVY|nr:hypothetical protein TRVL_06510 [Trypanosoma vivax]KAH8607822.1 hypothetical protein ERJ75_001341700 [Trypanosoma vivax]CCC51298.1 hypothetical protein TVY486_1003510 [Trypanosoma vivax Y486]